MCICICIYTTTNVLLTAPSVGGANNSFQICRRNPNKFFWKDASDSLGCVTICKIVIFADILVVSVYVLEIDSNIKGYLQLGFDQY